MPMVMLQDFDEFVAEHGGEYVMSRGWLLFADGSTTNEEFSIRRSPPINEHQRLELQREFWAVKTRLAEREFNELRNDALQQAAHAMSGLVPPPHADTPRELQRRKSEIETLRERVAEFDALIANTPESHEQRQREAVREERRREISALASEIEAIEV